MDDRVRVTNKLLKTRCRVRFMQREKTSDYSGWILYSGEEQAEELESPLGYSLIPAEDIISFDPDVRTFLGCRADVLLERNAEGSFLPVRDVRDSWGRINNAAVHTYIREAAQHV